MANAYFSLHFHCIFSTKNRQTMIQSSFEERLWAYMGGIAKEHGMTAVCIGGVNDHVHLLLGLPASLSVSKAMQLIKGGSSAWVNETFSRLRHFGWQIGYGAFTLGNSQIPATVVYIQNQKEHHKKISFRDEYLAFLRKHDINFEAKYVFD